MITIFCTPKNFEGIFNTIQKNAIRSWRQLSKDIEIIIFGNSKGAKEISIEVEGVYYPEVKCSKNGVPLLSDLFYKANKIASFDILLFINSDILLPQNIIEAIKKVNLTLSKYLLVGHRWDLEVKNLINFEESKLVSTFWKTSKTKSIKQSPAAIDYFIFRKNSLRNIPDFVIGRPGYDNWLIWYARRNFIPVIDLSKEVSVIHQEHHFNFHNLKNDPKVYQEEDGLSNLKIHGNKVLNLLDADYLMQNGKIIKKNSPEYKFRNVGKLPIIFPEVSLFLNAYKKLYRIFLYKNSDSS
tara:strand:- start:510 stop:1400 length:891 start_codon:yes stop_codon:yes gene_type:complete